MGRRVEVGAAPEADLLKLRTEDARARELYDRLASGDLVALGRALVPLRRLGIVLGDAISVVIHPGETQL